MKPTNQLLSTRRDFLQQCGAGAGLLGLSALLQQEGLGRVPLGANPMASRTPHFGGSAKAVIWLFINGGPSQVDTWDYKPALEKYHGKQLDGFDNTTGFFNKQVGLMAKSPFTFKQHGQSGAWVSEIFPHLSQHVDKMAFIKSFHTESNNHSPALFMMNTGVPRMGHPCVGSWATYGLGTENQDLPSFVVMSDPKNRGLPKGHAANWSSGFLPGVFQGTYFRPQGEPIPNLNRLGSMTSAQQEKQLRFLESMNRIHLAREHQESDLSADFVSDQLANGRRFRVLNIVDDYTREIVLQVVDFSISGYRVARELDRLERKLPKTIVCDNGPEFTCKAMFFWAKKIGTKLHFIQPGKPTQNAFVESFNGKFREYCLDMH